MVWSEHMVTKLVQGVGVNDADYHIAHKLKVNGVWREVWICPFYKKWKEMLRRCYSDKEHKRHPTYIGCQVCSEWLIFSNFKSWMETQDWEGKHLDKDLIGDGTLYSPETCVFVSGSVNSFLLDRQLHRGEYPLGVHLDKVTCKFMAMCSNIFTGKRENLGRFSCPEKAHLRWLERKNELACALADIQDDCRVANALRTRYKTAKDFYLIQVA